MGKTLNKNTSQFHQHKLLDMIYYKKFPFTELQGKLNVQKSLPGIPVMNQKLPIQSSHLSLLIQTSAGSSNQHVAAY
jgi:hypothetical protein